MNIFQRSLEILGLSQEEILNVLKIVSSVLKLGNVNFTPTNNIDGTEGCKINNEYGEVKWPPDIVKSLELTIINNYFYVLEVFEVCELLGMDPGAFQAALTSTTCITNSSIDMPLTELSASQATHYKNSLCRALYSRTFTWLVSRLNNATKVFKIHYFCSVLVLRNLLLKMNFQKIY